MLGKCSTIIPSQDLLFLFEDTAWLNQVDLKLVNLLPRPLK